MPFDFTLCDTHTHLGEKEDIMSKKLSFTQEELQAVIAQAVAQALASQAPSKSAKGTKASAKQKNGKGNAKLVEFTKADGTTVQCTQAQAKVWEAWRDGSADRKASKEANLAKFEANREAYKPSKALKDAIKADRASITRKVAKEKYGFVGTKEDLKALKESICK